MADRKKLLGDCGEALVASYLRKEGYTIAASRYRCRMGEVDLIVRKDAVLCFVEVKTRSNTDFGLPREAVGPRKQRRIRAAAAQYIAQYQLDCPMRFDVAEVYLDDAGAPEKARIEYLKAAFE